MCQKHAKTLEILTHDQKYITRHLFQCHSSAAFKEITLSNFPNIRYNNGML